ncbi:MAG: hypothetical protein IM650_05015 [Phenylobacterium sp.]|uniref:hypothetical protein n=1 Tax=Phenylobacterium sp. TaxID=1871053 RepID=UPI0025CCAF43|nr:hypothetical protein [Phenylobacterium sp.]MCA6230904.1 hypothetical protein [Phenylobacterium sp.]MCA6251066.1 hypothetical protein [Phenylobacterium sp.]MCA6257446.1 hypothetical protein [Phenylobacterium sp.]MCA6262425.1 hypothetical protein [Phenylobacterium sp.]MCA6265818.1 hypothetical protein [Phenylobacterium sp.]
MTDRGAGGDARSLQISLEADVARPPRILPAGRPAPRRSYQPSPRRAVIAFGA